MSTVPLMSWLPWMEEALRLHFMGKPRPVVARLVGKDESALQQVMKTEEWAERSVSWQAKVEALWQARMQDLWNLSPKAIETAKRVLEDYNRFDKHQERQTRKGYQKARQDAKAMAESLLAMVGLKSPEKMEVKSETHHTETRETKLTYEQRLHLIKEQRAAGLPVDQDLLDLPLKEHDG